MSAQRNLQFATLIGLFSGALGCGNRTDADIQHDLAQHTFALNGIGSRDSLEGPKTQTDGTLAYTTQSSCDHDTYFSRGKVVYKDKKSFIQQQVVLENLPCPGK